MVSFKYGVVFCVLFISTVNKILGGNEAEIEWFENPDIQNIITPVDVNKLKDLLIKSNYPKEKSEFLIEGFSSGFELKYQGQRSCLRREAPNLRICIGTLTDLWNKVIKEVKLGRYAGPF